MLINQLSSTQSNTSTYTPELSNQSNSKTTALKQQNKAKPPTQTTNLFTNTQRAKVTTSAIISANSSTGFLQSASQSISKLQDAIQVNFYNGKEIFSGAYEEISDTLVQTLKTKHQDQFVFNAKLDNSFFQKTLTLPSLVIDSSTKVQLVERQAKLLQEEIQALTQEMQNTSNSLVEQLQTERGLKLNEQGQNKPSSYPNKNTYSENFSSIARQKEFNWLLR